MSLQARNTKVSKKTEKMDVPEKGTHLARLVGLTDLGHQPGYMYQGEEVKSSFKTEFTYELVNSLMEDGRPHWVSEEINVSDYEGDSVVSTMMARVRVIDKDNITNDGKDLSKMLGNPCMVTISINDKGWPKLKGQAAVSGVPKGMEVPELQNPTFSFDMDDPDMDRWAKFSDFTKKKILSALNLNETELGRKLAEGDEEAPF